VLAGGIAAGAVAAEPVEVPTFGTNPGNLRMFLHAPDEIDGPAPLVVVLHGCRQTALGYGETSGWVEVADSHGFLLVLPGQRPANNDRNCFNWFQPGDARRDAGEALSIRQMIDHVEATHEVDEARVFVSGLSAGGAMTAVMLATYPEVFAGGGVVAGLPYRCADNVFEALQCMSTGRPSTLPAFALPQDALPEGLPATLEMSPAFCLFFPLLCPDDPGDADGAEAWGDLVRSASDHEGPFPVVSVWHGTADTTVVPVNATSLVEQWTDVHGISSEPTAHDVFAGFPRQRFEGADGLARVELYTVTGMGHGKPVDPGGGPEQCGTSADFVLDVDVCSSRLIAEFWGLASAE
jgi:poly(hydroxyalkanoate) depolymerase family esterase